MDCRAEEADQPILVEGGQHDRDIEEVPRREPWIVGDENIAGRKCLGRKRLDEVLSGSRQRVDMTGCAGHCLRHHTAATIEQSVGEIAGLAYDRAKGDALKRLCLLTDDADEIAPEDFKLDAVHAGYSLEAMTH